MNLGLDIDGVLTDIEDFQLRFGVPFFKKHFNKVPVNEKGFDIRQIFDASEEEYRKFWSKYLLQYAITWPARDKVSEYTDWAYANGHKVYIITARVFAAREDFMGKLMRFMVKRWLKKYGVRYENIVFCEEEKEEYIRKYNIRYMVEDNPKNIQALKEITGVICMNAGYNEHISDKSVVRCFDFTQVLNYVKNQAD